ncbi:MAG: hypothetical protein ACRD43_13350, partial [Pyrinomonadaceae bacterium]
MLDLTGGGDDATDPPPAESTFTRYLNGPGIDNKLSLSTPSNTEYFLADHLGSTNGLTDSLGTVTEQTAYDSFGNPTVGLSTRYQ